ncbi:MAG: class B sortase [Ruminococcus sp.]|nr:class B sortase [Ruminococcus sp.]
MNENQNQNDTEALSRAERIKAIKNSLHNLQEEQAEESHESAEAAAEAEAAPPVQVTEEIPADEEELAKTRIMPVPDERPPSPPPVRENVQPVGTMPGGPVPPPMRAVPEGAAAVPKKKKKKKKKTVGQNLRGLFPEKGDSFFEVLRKIIFLISIIAIIVCGYLVADYYLDLWRNGLENNSLAELYNTYPVNNQPADETKEEKYYEMLTGAKKLMDINPEVIGYMTIEDTPVDLPVVQASDNDKYLNINFNGEESRAGALFLDYRNHYDDVTDHHLNCENSDNLVVYGHNMGDDSMFGCLKYYYRNVDYYEKHPVIQFNSNYAAYTYKIFAFFIVDADDETDTKYDCWNKLDFADEKEFYKFVNEAKRRTLRLNDVDVKYGDKLLTLSTCNDDVLVDRGRLIVMARLVRDGEDPVKGTVGSQANPNIKWPSMYYATKKNEKYDTEAEFVPYGPEK